MIEVEPHVCSITRYYHVKGSLINEELPPDSTYKVCQKLYSRLCRKINQNKQATSNQSPTPKRQRRTVEDMLLTEVDNSGYRSNFRNLTNTNCQQRLLPLARNILASVIDI